jgi:hypothetical protein
MGNISMIFGQHSEVIGFLTWHDKQRVMTVSTYHTDEMHMTVSRGKEITKPGVVSDYNNHMGGVDLKDQMLQQYTLE